VSHLAVNPLQNGDVVVNLEGRSVHQGTGVCAQPIRHDLLFSFSAEIIEVKARPSMARRKDLVEAGLTAAASRFMRLITPPPYPLSLRRSNTSR